MNAEMIHFEGLPGPLDEATRAALLAPTDLLDFPHPAVQSFIGEAGADRGTEVERAVALFYAVRDRIRYDPYQISSAPADYRASSVTRAGHGWCVPKASLLAACARAVGIPAAIGLADVTNHLNTEKLRARMGGTDVFYDHGYVALLIDDRWVKAVPAFNIELCQRFGVSPTEFDGRSDALYQQYNARGELHMSYLADHGCWSDLPLGKMFDDFARHYPSALITQGATVESSRFEEERPLA
jgi:transglutaminase-like putative cysteine protease